MVLSEEEFNSEVVQRLLAIDTLCVVVRPPPGPLNAVAAELPVAELLDEPSEPSDSSEPPIPAPLVPETPNPEVGPVAVVESEVPPQEDLAADTGTQQNLPVETDQEVQKEPQVHIYTEEELAALSYRDVQAVAKSLTLSAKGSESELIARILEAQVPTPVEES